ncbi:MAG: cytochrome c biogenesis protein, partial [Planctomycetaceae bacterium]
WQDERRFEYRSKEIEERFRKIRMAQMQEGDSAKVGDTEEEQELNEKVQELIVHVEAFIVTAGANNLLVVPNLDPRILTEQTNPDVKLDPWISLGALVRASELLRAEERARERLRGGDVPPQLQGLGQAELNERLREYRADVLRSLADPDPTLFALLAEDHVELADSLVLRGTIQKSREVAREMGIELDRTWNDFVAIHRKGEGSGQFPASAYPIEHVPQLAQARQHRDRLLPMIEEISPALEKTREAYDELNENAFASAMRTFTAKIHRLGEALDEARADMTAPDQGEIVFGEYDAAIWQQYEPLELSERQAEYSAYPEKGATDVELLYNRQRPFAKAWIFFLLATVIVAMSYVSQAFTDSRRPPLIVYGVGMVAAVGALAYSAWGFSLRVMITGWAPVTNMYETVIWVGSVVPLLGLWFALLPVTWPGLRWAWRLTGPPLRLSRNASGSVNGIEPATLRPDERGRFLASLWLPIQLLTTGLRCGAAAAIVLALTQSDTSYDILSILPPMGTAASVGSIGIWAIGMALLALVAWYVPRGIMTLLLGVITLLPELMQENLEAVAEKVLMRRFFLLPALVIATFTMMLSHFVGILAPEILNPRIGSISAVLRNRFWLYVHVLTIVSSYAAGALAWGLGNVALLYYLFGRYRKEVGVTDDAEPLPGEANDRVFDRIKKAGGAIAPNQVGRTLRQSFRGFGSGDGDLAVRVRPPKEVSTLASYTYATIMVATILLGIGTILGGLWADVSWGRFWDWDPKEVWALISFLVYIAVLHGRLAGWLGTFGTNVGSVLCFNAILMSWYGVNFVLPQVHGWLNGTGEATEVGLHSYATGAGGLEYVAGAVGLNLLLVLLASGRYVVETSGDDGGTPPAAREEREVPVEV